MFGMSFTEILVIMVVAIIFLGPEKLPNAVLNIAKLFKQFRSIVSQAQETIQEQLNVEDLKKEALSYKEALEKEVKKVADIPNQESKEIKDLFGDLTQNTQKQTQKPKKESKKNKEIKDLFSDLTQEPSQDLSQDLSQAPTKEPSQKTTKETKKPKKPKDPKKEDKK